MGPCVPAAERRSMRTAAKTPEEICRLFQECIREGDLDSVLDLYDPDVVFVSRSGEPKSGKEALRAELSPFTAAKANFEFDVKEVVQAGDIALMHTVWTMSPLEQTSLYAIEVARRQPDGTWRWLIGDPYTVGRKEGGILTSPL
jgi:uncharacterized protein (TIGR02246 family)